MISILICTRDRAQSLQETLDALKQLAVPLNMECELVVVDNGSSDNTRELVESTRLPQMPVRYVYEPKKGKGNAYNTGMAEAQGEIFLWTDDDVRPPRDWIEGMCAPILAGEADAIAGGVNIPEHLREAASLCPWWVASTMDIGSESSKRLVGANMAFGRHVLTRVPHFDEELGPGALGFHDETLFSLQLNEAGFNIQSRFDIAVDHHFDATRLTREGWLSTAARIARSDAYIDHHWKHNGRLWTKVAKLLCHASLLWRRIRFARKYLIQQKITDVEIARVQEIAYFKQLKHEMQRPRNYELHGLKKLSHGNTPWGSDS